ncbi:hypothetical protein GCM10011491_21820 [Brucella endophytica]|uniref:DUF423 domain-containing protein n=1 Tax=Brucella endophytica TaxID=1963359 RepID=A0A916SCZ7_9HYPH|nr:DUF423 domain-containing protein [Brucella endophytica]GGA93338.1 hypothetical protein GCM10011491_21820 [Brucella endophytica]
MARELYRPFALLGALSGAAAIAAYAASAHGGSANLGTLAPLLLGHAPALLVLSLLAPGRMVARLGGWVILLGLLLFTGDLLMRDLTGDRLFPYAAPSGGTLMMLGWVIAGAGLMTKET